MTKTTINISKVLVIITLVLIMIIPFQTVQGQTETPTPHPYIDPVDIDGTDLGIERVITLGELAISIILLGILATFIVYVTYRLVIDKIN